MCTPKVEIEPVEACTNQASFHSMMMSHLSSVGLVSESGLKALDGLFCLLCPLRSAPPCAGTQTSSSICLNITSNSTQEVICNTTLYIRSAPPLLEGNISSLVLLSVSHPISAGCHHIYSCSSSSSSSRATLLECTSRHSTHYAQKDLVCMHTVYCVCSCL